MKRLKREKCGAPDQICVVFLADVEPAFLMERQ